MGIRTEAIGLGVEVDNWHLSQFGYTSFQVSNWTDDMIGITATGDDLSDQIYDDTTSKSRAFKLYAITVCLEKLAQFSICRNSTT